MTASLQILTFWSKITESGVTENFDGKNEAKTPIRKLRIWASDRFIKQTEATSVRIL